MIRLDSRLVLNSSRLTLSIDDAVCTDDLAMMNKTRLLMLCLLLLTSAISAFVAADDQRDTRKHPYFRPVIRPELPAVHGNVSHPIDRFIIARLQARQMTLNSGADRATLIRRVCFDLTGLPPTIPELEAFLSDKSQDAYSKMVDRYLASPHYGERWGKYWLDAAGYADSNGYFNADSDRPLAWKYRDYVIKSFNADKPYDQFVREQLAGDELVGYSPNNDVTPGMLDGLIATHFLRNAPDGTGESDGNPDEVRTDRFTVLEGNIQNLMNCLLGLTVQCARCHDHKFEPISQKEYYSLQAILFPVYQPDQWIKPNDRVVFVGSKKELAARQRLNEQIERQLQALKTALSGVADPLREQLLDERLSSFDETTRSKVIEAVKIAKEKRTPAQEMLLKTHAKAVKISDDDLAKRFPEYSRFREQTRLVMTEREKNRPPQTEKVAPFVENSPKSGMHRVLKRGQHNQPGEEVQPGVPAQLCTPQNSYLIEPRPSGQVSSGRRSALAKWMTSAENPLLARVIVNRIWHHHFGTGIVATVDNLGASGAKPSHPELLDFLASEFVQSRWSVKQLHRLIMTSLTYRQASTSREGQEALDPENRLLARFPLRRLDAEALRDAILHITGELQLEAGGPYVPSKRTSEGIVEIDEKTAGACKRSVYLQQRRTQVVTFLQLFDAPTIVSTCGTRTVSTVPLQSLVFLNSEFIRTRSKALANRLTRETGSDPAKRIELAFRLLCSRAPLKDEIVMCQSFLAKQREVYAGAKDSDLLAWTDLCQMLFASNAFLYVE